MTGRTSKVLSSIQSAPNTLGKLIHELGNVFVELNEPFKSKWIQGGSKGANFRVTTEGHLLVENEGFRIDDVEIEDCNEFINVYFEPFNKNRFAAFDVVQRDSDSLVIGGERFEYRPLTISGRSSKKKENTFVQSEYFMIYPNPTSGMLNVALKDLEVDLGSIEIFDLHGRKVVEIAPPDSIIPNTNMEVDVSQLATGLYLLIARDGNGIIIDDLKFVRE